MKGAQMSTDTDVKRRAVVIGGTSGLGLAVAELFHRTGADVVLGARTSARFQAALQRLGGEARAESVDVTSEESVVKFFAAVGPFDYLVVTASGALADKPLAETRVEDLELFAETKLWGALRCVKLAVPSLADGGSITLVSGAVSQKGRSGAHGKTIVNSALEGLARSLAVELGPRLRVNCVSPAMFDSKGTMPAQRRDELRGMYPGGYVGSATDVAAMLHAAATNPFMSGSVLYVDSGWTAS
jgi:NAD(P)-dependent dehydrogenase (short-subunit alcohol dehydrogenase family)